MADRRTFRGKDVVTLVVTLLVAAALALLALNLDDQRPLHGLEVFLLWFGVVGIMIALTVGVRTLIRDRDRGFKPPRNRPTPRRRC